MYLTFFNDIMSCTYAPAKNGETLFIRVWLVEKKYFPSKQEWQVATCEIKPHRACFSASGKNPRTRLRKEICWSYLSVCKASIFAIMSQVAPSFLLTSSFGIWVSNYPNPSPVLPMDKQVINFDAQAWLYYLSASLLFLICCLETTTRRKKSSREWSD